MNHPPTLDIALSPLSRALAILDCILDSLISHGGSKGSNYEQSATVTMLEAQIVDPHRLQRCQRRGTWWIDVPDDGLDGPRNVLARSVHGFEFGARDFWVRAVAFTGACVAVEFLCLLYQGKGLFRSHFLCHS